VLRLSSTPDEIATAEVDQAKAKSKEKSKKDKGWPAQAVKIESVVNRAAVHKGMKSTTRPSTHKAKPLPALWHGDALAMAWRWPGQRPCSPQLRRHVVNGRLSPNSPAHTPPRRSASAATDAGRG
jgi:hypothetical protein